MLRIHNRFDEILLMYFMHFCALWFPRFLVHNLKNTNNNEKKKILLIRNQSKHTKGNLGPD